MFTPSLGARRGNGEAFENTFRAVNIGMVNEMARLCYALNIDTWEVIRAAATKPFGFMPFYPGPEIGGHCIPLDPHYFSWKARQHGFDSRFISLAEEVNSRMPEHVIQLVADGLNEDRKPMKGSTCCCSVWLIRRTSTTFAKARRYRSSIVCVLRAQRALSRSVRREVRFDDAHTEAGGEALRSVPLTNDELHDADCVIIVTDHSEIDYKRVCALAPLIVDTRNALNGDLPARQSKPESFDCSQCLKSSTSWSAA